MRTQRKDMNIRPMESKDRETVLKLIHETGMFTEEEERVAAELIDTYLTQPDQKNTPSTWWKMIRARPRAMSVTVPRP